MKKLTLMLLLGLYLEHGPISWSQSNQEIKNILPCHGYSLEHLLDSCGIASKCHGHLQSLWWDVAHGCLDVVGDPFNEVGWVLVLNVKHLFVHFLGRHTSTEESRSGQVATMARISCAHHVLGIEHPCRRWGQEETWSLTVYFWLFDTLLSR